ncbi:PREDICTED: uncharacterized protein LOC105312138 isoform X2 [Amphimedon queenslandica]|uniref:separase n=1 Tax=Amphimedon queenslandica TaxID=400682 RepID=A0AAN0IZZ3_AMPQE|nr:PREDICTED: uncharacterized protein LOC105312138 isoform X2 [Amphimedon queenslandica]|eukprot:XP_019850112.1 PREDICTED: uncharacterized protein LOC105312138 isoform X2 [Amphimedon queenslandica]
MAGENIILLISKDEITEELASEMKGYLYPLKSSKKQKKKAEDDTKDILKYQDFVIKALGTIVKVLPQSSHPLLLLKMAEDSVSFFNTSVTTNKASSNLFYKYNTILIHLSKKSINFLTGKDPSLADRAMDIIQSTLHGLYTQLANGFIQHEREALIKGTACVLWNAASKWSSIPSKIERVLNVCRLSIECYFLLPSHVSSGLEKALIIDKQYRAAVNKNNSESRLSLSCFHVSLLTNPDLLLSLEGSSPLDCQAILHIILWLTLGSLPSCALKNSKEVNKFIDMIQKTLKRHSKICKSNDHTLVKVLVSLHQLATASISQSHQINSLLIRSFPPSLLSTVDLSLLSPNQLMFVAELIQSSLLEMKNLKWTSPLSAEAFSSLNIILQLCCQCLEGLIKSFSVSLIRSKQAITYGIVMDILMASLRQPSYDTKLISRCLPLVESLRDLLKTVQLPLLEDREEVATYSFNFGLALYQSKCYTEAAPLLKVACEEYLYCSKESEDFEEKIIEVKLFMKYTLLVECLVESGDFASSVRTIEEMLRTIYDNKINNKTIILTCLNQFITCKCHLRASTNFNEESLLSRSSLDWLESSPDNKLKFLYLSQELEASQSLMQDTRDWQLSLTLQLLALEENKRSHYYAWLLIKQASLSHSLQSTDSQGSPSDVLSKAIVLLKSLQDSVDSRCMSSDLLGLAYLWRGIFMHSSCMSKSESIMSLKANRDLYDVLGVSIDHWSKVLNHIDNIRKDSLSVKKCFLNFSSTLHHLVLFSSFTNGLLFHKLTLRLLDLIITLSDRFSTASSHESLYQSLAKKAMLLLYENGLHSISPELKSKLEKTEVMEYSREQEEVCVAQLECKLALAAIFIQNGELNDALSLFKVILSHPVLTHSRSFVHHFLSSAATLLSLLLTTTNYRPPIKEVNEILSFILHSKNGHCDYKDCDCDHIRTGLFKLTDFELSFHARKLTHGLVSLLMSSYSPNSTKPNLSETGEDNVMVPESHLLASPPSKAWGLFSSLLSNAYSLSGQYLSRGLINESLLYAKEGLELAKKLQLLYWTTKFTIHMAKISITSADVAASIEHIQTATELMGLEKQTIIPSTSKDVKSVGESVPDTATSSTRSVIRKPQSATKAKSKIDFKPIARATRTPATRRSTRSRVKASETATPLHRSTRTESVSVPQSGGIVNQLCDGIEVLSLGSPGITSDCHHQFLIVTLSLIVSQYHLLNKDTSSCLSVLDSIAKLLSDLREEVGIELILPHEIDSLRLRSKALLDLGSFTEAKALERNRLLQSSSLSRWMHLPAIRLPLAGLYYNISIATIELFPSIQADGIYSNNFRTSSRAEEKAPPVVTQKKRRVRRITDSDDDDEEEEGGEKELLGFAISQSLRPVLSYLLLAYQLLMPVTLSCPLVRDLYQSLGHVFSVLHVELSAHFFLLSSSVSLEQEAVYWFGRRIRKENGHSLKVILSEMVSTITTTTSSSAPAPPSLSPLIKARSMLHPLPHPLPLDYTRNMRGSLPEDWVYCLCTLTERAGGKRVLVIIRIKNNQDPIVVKIPLGATTQEQQPGDEGVTCDQLESKFNAVMSESVSTSGLTDRTVWWGERIKLDKQLQDLVVKLESVWLGHWKLLLLPTPPLSSSLSPLSSLLSANGLSSSTAWAEVLVAGKRTLGYREFDLVLSSLLDKRKRNKGEIEKAIEDCVRHSNSTSSPVILSLSKSLHSLPFENIPLLRNQLVTRIPSLQFLCAGLTLQTERGQSGINPSSTYYVINPSGDLKRTQEVFADWFEREVGWTGVIGRRPSTDEFISGLKDHDTFIYCGHGNGREYLGKNQKLQDLHTKATVLQMGCSSGKLKSVGNLDPHGMAHNFLIAGCPFLVANLWTVTDGDIDRFCTTLVKKGLSTKRKQRTTHDELLCSLSEARDSCKLKYLIGASPVVYGLPLTK